MGRNPLARILLALLPWGLVGCAVTVSTTTPVPLGTDRAALAGPWYNAKWRDLVLRVEETGPQSLRLVWVREVGPPQAVDARIIPHDGEVYLDAVDAGMGFERPAEHRLYKVRRSVAWELGVGQSRPAKLRQFHYSPTKSYQTLQLIPLRTAYLEGHPGLRLAVRTAADASTQKVVAWATGAEVEQFLNAHGGDEDAWDDDENIPELVQKIEKRADRADSAVPGSAEAAQPVVERP